MKPTEDREARLSEIEQIQVAAKLAVESGYELNFGTEAMVSVDWLITELKAAWADIKLLEKQSQGRWDKGEAVMDHNCQLMEQNHIYWEALEKMSSNTQHLDKQDDWNLSVEAMSIIEAFQIEARKALGKAKAIK